MPAGWKTHIASEITHVADVYDALRSDRPYRQGLPPETAAQMMNADSGRVFDPYVLKVFFEQVAPRLTWRKVDLSSTPAAPGAEAVPAPEPARRGRGRRGRPDRPEHRGPTRMSTLADGPAKASILIADDDASNREVLSYYLRRQGYDVLAVADGELALAAIAERRFSLVLLDVVMPGLDGLEALRRIRRVHGARELPVILFTGLDAAGRLRHRRRARRQRLAGQAVSARRAARCRPRPDRLADDPRPHRLVPVGAGRPADAGALTHP